VEVTSLADRDLSMREFVPVFVTLMGVMAQFASHQGADTWVITVNPRHRLFYQKVMGFVPIGAQKAYPAVQNHPAEAFAGTIPLLAANAPAMYEQIFREALPESVLAHSSMSVELVRYFAAHSSQTNLAAVEEILERIVVNQDAGH
jgi:N-acyl-L-homoserine lactone synthetase